VIRISTTQMAGLAQPRRAEFLDRVREFVAARAGSAPDEAALQTLFDRGTGYGLVSEQQYAGYLVLAWASKTWRAESDPEWITRILADPHRVPDDKVAALFRAADRGAWRT
jgi:hypothetical protein